MNTSNSIEGKDTIENVEETKKNNPEENNKTKYIKLAKTIAAITFVVWALSFFLLFLGHDSGVGRRFVRRCIELSRDLKTENRLARDLQWTTLK